MPLSQSLYWRPPADQKASGLWVRDWPGTLLDTQNSGQRSDRSRMDWPEDLRRLTKISEFFRRPLRITRRQNDKNKIKNKIGVL